MINPVPAALRFLRGWPKIQGKVEADALKYNRDTYRASPKKYQFSGWGIAVPGWFPCLACNVYYWESPDKLLDLGRYVGN